MKRLEGKVALVTGGGMGIGAAIAMLFADEGAKVFIADINEEKAAQTVTAIQRNGGEAIFIRCDVSKEDEVQKMVEDTVNAFGRLDIAVNNAGITGPVKKLTHIQKTEWDQVVAINLTGVLLCMKHEIRQMEKQQTGSVINMASISGLAGTGYSAPYTTTKHGVVGLSKDAAVDYADKNIRINVICPGPVDTPMLRGALQKRMEGMGLNRDTEDIYSGFPRRVGKATDVACAALWLASDEAAFVTGSVMVVDGGMIAGGAAP